MGILDSLGFGAPQPDPMQQGQMQAMQGQVQQPGLGSRINSGIADNSGMMMALGGQLLAHRQNATNPMFDAQALMVGQQVDEKRRDKRKEEEKERRGRQAAIQSLLELGIAPNEQVAGQLVDVHPDLAAKALEKQYLSEPKTKDPIKVGGALLDPNTYEPLYQSKPEKIQLYEAYRDQELREGRPPLSLNDWDLQSRKASAQQINIGGKEMTPGRKKVDTEFAKEAQTWTTGGRADVEKQLSQLEETVEMLESGDNHLTGPIVGSTPDFVSSVINPESIVARENVEEVVQRSLRAILGAQFTEKEGERLIARAYNPRLQEGDNATRVRRLLDQIKTMAAAKDSAVRYFNEHGTLMGWEGGGGAFSGGGGQDGWQELAPGVRIRRLD